MLARVGLPRASSRAYRHVQEEEQPPSAQQAVKEEAPAEPGPSAMEEQLQAPEPAGGSLGQQQQQLLSALHEIKAKDVLELLQAAGTADASLA